MKEFAGKNEKQSSSHWLLKLKFVFVWMGVLLSYLFLNILILFKIFVPILSLDSLSSTFHFQNSKNFKLWAKFFHEMNLFKYTFHFYHVVLAIGYMHINIYIQVYQEMSLSDYPILRAEMARRPGNNFSTLCWQVNLQPRHFSKHFSATCKQ